MFAFSIERMKSKAVLPAALAGTPDVLKRSKPCDTQPPNRELTMSRGCGLGASWDFSATPVVAPDRPRQAGALLPMPQPKLLLGPIDDRLEYEADRAADQVTAMAAPPTIAAGVTAAPHRRSDAGSITGEFVTTLTDVLRSPGEPLNASARAFFEPRFGANFSQVRLHTDARAAQSARTIGALSYTVGPHIAFAQVTARLGLARASACSLTNSLMWFSSRDMPRS